MTTHPLGDDYVPPDEPLNGWTREEAAEIDRARLTVVPEGGANEASPTAQQDRFQRLDWREAFARDFSQIDYLPGRFMERGQQVSLVGDGKAGKSLLTEEWLIRCIKGQRFLGDTVRDPLTSVLYFDRENSVRDIVTRARALGATEEDLDLFMERFDYRPFPRFSGALDASHVASAELLGIVSEVKPDVVVLDTVSRFIAGNENDSKTWLDFYGRVHAPLKALGVACLRLDHYGKDQTRGSRGSSAKNQDVDHVWELSVLAQNKWHDLSDDTELITTHLKMHRTYTRTGIGEDEFLITRRGRRVRGGMWLDGSTRHALTAEGQGVTAPEGSVEYIVERLNADGLQRNAGRNAVKERCAELGLPTTTKKLEQVVKLRKNLPSNLPYPPVGQQTRDPRAGEGS